MDNYQLSAETDRIASQSTLKFLLVENSFPVRLDLELTLRKRFPKAIIERFFPEAGNSIHRIIWQNYDLVVIATEIRESDLTWLHNIQRTRARLPLVIVLTEDEGLGREVVWAGADLALPLHESSSEMAARLDNLLEVSRALNRYPLQLPQWHFLELLHNSENSVIF
ncbi:MAG: hypothetical protein WBP46_13550 [Thiolinea sp.]